MDEKKRGARDKLAEYAHIAWSGWMLYLFKKSTRNEDGTITIPVWAVERWERQAGTAFHRLPETEKESDYHEADMILGLIETSDAEKAH